MNVVCLLCGLLIHISYINCLPPPCDSNIYCYGSLLHVVQMAHVFPDSKTFVDMKMKKSPSETLRMFQIFMNDTKSKPNGAEVHKFLHETFDPPASEFKDWDPVDWTEHPKFLNKINDLDYRKWAGELNHFWKRLGRVIKDDVKENPELYSIIYVPNPVIVPGGRFREFYYWDSYWIIRGLLLSEMNFTVKGMLKNFLSMVKTFGFIPNGGRVYYARRSQPPLLIPMVKSYLDKTKDIDFLKENIDLMEREFVFWMTNHTTIVEKDGKKFKLAHYYAPSDGPRPESYREDFISAQYLKTEEEKQNHYIQLKTAAESGWDFSTRWFILNGTNKGNLSNTNTQYIIPVDLNAILHWNARLLSEFYGTLNMTNESTQYKYLADKWLEAVTQILWHEDVGAWLDYDILNNVRRNYFYPTNLAPLWTGCYKKDQFPVGKVMKYLERTEIMRHLGGVPTSMELSGEQWDYPNAWPPLQYIVIMALNNLQDSWPQHLALELAERWVRSNYRCYNDSDSMYEKYDATFPGGHGGGGEYINQLGFGWTNGVILELLDKYGSHLSVRDSVFSDKEKYNTTLNSATQGHPCIYLLMTVTVYIATFI